MENERKTMKRKGNNKKQKNRKILSISELLIKTFRNLYPTINL